MNKKVEENIEIVQNENSNPFLLITLILLFCITLFISVKYIVKYHEGKKLHGTEQRIEIKTKDANASIINNGLIEQVITSDSFKEEDEIILEKVNIIEMISNNEKENDISFDIKYDIIENDFKMNTNASNKSEVLVRFSYSYDNENWTYVNNALSTNNSNIMPLIGNNYDIAGLVTKLNIATDYKLSATNKELTKMYWRSETIFKNVNPIKKDKKFKANFTISA